MWFGCSWPLLPKQVSARVGMNEKEQDCGVEDNSDRGYLIGHQQKQVPLKPPARSFLCLTHRCQGLALFTSLSLLLNLSTSSSHGLAHLCSV